MTKSSRKKLIGAAVIMVSAMIFSRMTGFLRSMLIPNMLGTNTLEADALNISYSITSLMYSMLVGGAMASALIPVLSGYIIKKEEEKGWKAVSTFLNVSVLGTIVLCILGIVFSPQLVPLFTQHDDLKSPEAMELTVSVTRILFPSVAFLMFAGLSNGVMNAYQRFASAAYGPVVYNLGTALSLLFLSRYGVKTVAFGVMCSSIFYFLFQFSFAAKNFKCYRPEIDIKNKEFRQLLLLALPSIAASSIAQLNIIVSSSFSTAFGTGSITNIRMADDIWQLPFGIFTMSIIMAVLPTLSERLATGDIKGYKELLLRVMKNTVTIIFPSAIGLLLLKNPIASAIFRWNEKFPQHTVENVGMILGFFALALVAQSFVAILNRGFYAANNTKTPLFIGTLTVVLNFAVCLIFYYHTSFEAAGMALAFSISSSFNAIMLFVLLNRRMNGLSLGRLLKHIVKVLSATAIMGFIIVVLQKLHPLMGYTLAFEPSLKIREILELAIEITFAALIYFVLLLVFKVSEAWKVIELLKSKFINNNFNKNKL